MDSLLYMLLTSSFFMILFLFLRAVFRKKISMRLQYALWLVVVMKLLLPIPLLESKISFFNLIDKWEYFYQRQNQETYTNTKNFIHIDFEHTIQENMQTSDWQNFNIYGVNSKTQNFVENSDIRKGTINQPDYYSDKNSPKYENFLRRFINLENSYFLPICFVIAGLGSCILLVYFVTGNMRFAKFLYRGRMRYEGVDSLLPIYIVEGLPSPCLYGKAIYITPNMTTDERCFSHILAHEYCHYRQGDLIWSVLRCFCLICYWWNPLVWLSAYLSKQDCELSCDEAALQLLGEKERIPYGETLISLIPVTDKRRNYFSIVTTMTEGGNIKIQYYFRIKFY